MTAAPHSKPKPTTIKREDHPLVKGAGTFVSDVSLNAPLHVAFVRSNIAAGILTQLALGEALAAQDVVAVHKGSDVAGLGTLSVNEVLPLLHQPKYEILVQTQIAAVGQPLAAVLAQTPAAALHGAEQVLAEIEDGTALERKEITRKHWQQGDWHAVHDHADVIVECEIQHARLAPSPLEPRAIAVAYDAQTDGVTVWHSTQTPHRSRNELAAILGIEKHRVRVIAPHVGGAFGMKGSIYPEEVFAVWAAFHHKRDVRWTATRSEEFLSATQGRGVTSRGCLAVTSDGKFLGLWAKTTAPIGPWLPNSGLVTAWNAGRILPSGYRVETLDVTTTAQQDGLGPVGIYRGAGRPEANALMERLVDKAAQATGLDPIEIRLKNLLPQSALPHTTATGDILDSGDYARALTMLAATADYQKQCKDRDIRRSAGELVGLGFAFYVEPSGSGWETADVTLNVDGTAHVASGSSSQGHGRETAFAQIASQFLRIPPDRITVAMGDTANGPEGIGAVASRSTAIGGSAVRQACEEITLRQSKGEPLPITAQARYENKGQAWGYGAYLVVLSVCKDTGLPTLEKAFCVDDAGRLVNARLVDGQILGGFAQGVGEAMLERVVYDADGQLLTGSFMDYAMPRASDIPPLTIDKFETPSPMNLLGAKGIGEAGTIGAPAAILNAAIDALAPLGVTDLQMPLTSNTLWHAMQDAKKEPDT